MIEYLTTYGASFAAGLAVMFFIARDYIKRILPDLLKSKASAHFDEHFSSLDPEELLPAMNENNCQLIDKRIEIYRECEAHIEDLSVAYTKQDETRIQRCRDAAMSAIGAAQAVPKPSFVPNTHICEAHAAVHAAENAVNQMNSMEAAYRMAKGLGGMGLGGMFK